MLLAVFMVSLGFARAQAVPNAGERVERLIIFGTQSDKNWGDDFSQTFFFLVPAAQHDPVYIRVWDPGCGGKNDDLKGPANTITSFSLYDGPGTFIGPQARDPRPTNPVPTGRRLKSQDFGNEVQHNGKQYTFGPFNPL